MCSSCAPVGFELFQSVTCIVWRCHKPLAGVRSTAPLRTPSGDGALESSLNPCSATAETERRNHFIDEFVIGPQFAIGGDPTQYLGQLGSAVVVDGSTHRY